MSLRRRYLFGSVLLVLVLWLGQVAPASAIPSSTPGAACTNPQVSAENQYCEQIPSADGPNLPNSGAHLGSTAHPGVSVWSLLTWLVALVAALAAAAGAVRLVQRRRPPPSSA